MTVASLDRRDDKAPMFHAQVHDVPWAGEYIAENIRPCTKN